MPGERRSGAAARTVAMGLTMGVLWGYGGAWGIPPVLATGAEGGARRAVVAGPWTLLGPPQQGGLSSFALSPQSARWIYAVSAAGSTLYATADGGATWTSLPVPPTDDDNSFALQVAVDPRQPEGIYLASQGFSLGGHSINFLSHSTDSGASWATLPAPAIPAWVAVDPQSSQILYTGPPLARSADGGISWSLPSGLPSGVASAVIDPSSPSTVYALASGSPNLYKSFDRGLTWTPAGATIGNLARLAVDPGSSSTLFAAAGGDLEKSADGGATWTVVYAPGNVDQNGVTAVALAPTVPTTTYASARVAASWSPLPGQRPTPRAPARASG